MPKISIEMVNPVVLISGSANNSYVINKALHEFEKEGVNIDIFELARPLDTDKLHEILNSTKDCKIYIVLTSISISLSSIVASTVKQPVIAVPVTAPSSDVVSSEELVSIGHMPDGVPLASVGINAGKNAAQFAIKILRAFA